MEKLAFLAKIWLHAFLLSLKTSYGVQNDRNGRLIGCYMTNQSSKLDTFLVIQEKPVFAQQPDANHRYAYIIALGIIVKT